MHCPLDLRSRDAGCAASCQLLVGYPRQELLIGVLLPDLEQRVNTNLHLHITPYTVQPRQREKSGKEGPLDLTRTSFLMVWYAWPAASLLRFIPSVLIGCSQQRATVSASMHMRHN